MYKKTARSSMIDTYKVKPMFGVAPDDIMSMICDFAFGAPWDTVRYGVPLCAIVQECAPPDISNT